MGKYATNISDSHFEMPKRPQMIHHYPLKGTTPQDHPERPFT